LKAKILPIIASLIALFSCENSAKTALHIKDGRILKAKTGLRALKQNSDAISDAHTVEQLDNTKGLSNSSVNCIFQDSENLIWIGTWDGLNRYDGNEFKIFRPEPGNRKSLSNQVILNIGEDRAGKIWILTMHGLNSYDKHTNTFTSFQFSKDSNTPLSEAQFNMAIDNSKNVFCAVKGWGIGFYNGISFTKIDSGFLDGKTIKKLRFLRNGTLIALTQDNDLFRLNLKTSSTGKKSIDTSKRISGQVDTFEIMPNQNICMVTTPGEVIILSMDNKTHRVDAEKNVESIIGNSKEGLVLLCKSGYLTIDAGGKVVKTSRIKNIVSQKITALREGNEDILWIGTDGEGVFKIQPQKKSFNLVTKTQLNELDGGIVRTFVKASDGTFFIGTKGKGLFRFPSGFLQHNEKPFRYENFDENNSAIHNSVFSLNNGSDNLVYIGSDGTGIQVFDSERSRLISWKQIVGTNKCDYFKSTYAIYQDKNGFIWLGTNGYGMIRCRIVRTGVGLKISDFKRYTADAEGQGNLSSNIIFSIIPGNDEQLWIGTRLGGLNLFDKKTEKFVAYKNNPGDPASLSSNDVLCLVKDSANKLWIGTSFGLNALETNNAGKSIFKSYTVKDGLPNNTIHGIVSADQSSIWLSTNFGLSNFITDADKFINYSKNDGLQNNEFADGAFYRDSISGYIFMGGIKGFNYFLPQKIMESKVLPDLFIDRISGQNRDMPYYQSVLITPDHTIPSSIALNHDQNFFDIHLTALTFTNNEKCKYAYQLEGFDKNWNTIDNRKVISFTNVPRGNYLLRLRWSNADGVWTKPVRAIAITIHPAWWQSNTAVVIYGILIILFVFFVMSYYLKRKSLRQKLLFIKNEEELHENRLTFFTNIAHEFLTPLTLIAGPIEKIAESGNLDVKNKKFVTMIQRNTSRLLLLTQQLLEFRKAEYDYLDVSVKHFDLVNLLEQIAELFDDWAFDKNIDYTIDIPQELSGWFDKDKLEKIIFNLLSNAFKYTPANGKINISCTIENTGTKMFDFTITNTGKGISKDKLESLFDRFFLSDTNQSSDTELFRTGIGLAFIKKLVTVLRGDIFVSSIPNEETRFKILIPCDRSAFSDKEIDTVLSAATISNHLKNVVELSVNDTGEIRSDKIIAFEVVENQKKVVLIVEDEKEIHLFLSDLLKEEYRIVSAYNGVEALAAIAVELPDIIISDVMMPIMDGVELCKTVKTDLRTCHIPFIMLTAKNSVVHRIEGLENGANSYIPKPFYPDHLLIRIKKLLEEKQRILQHFTSDIVTGEVAQIHVSNSDKDFIKVVIDLVRKNVDSEHLNSAFLEKILAISNSALYRKTKEIFGLSPSDLIRTIRLKYAAELLRKNVLTVSEVCYRSGFNNRSYFYREFKKLYNTTPKNYQMKYSLKKSFFSNN